MIFLGDIMTKKKSEQKDGAVIIATEEKKVKFGGSATGNTISEEDEEMEGDNEDEVEDEEMEGEDEDEDEDLGEDEDEDLGEDEDEDLGEDEDEDDSEEDDEEIVKNMKKSPIKESTDHIIGIVSTGKLHLLEDGIMGVVKSKVREKIDEQKEQIRAKLVFKGE